MSEQKRNDKESMICLTPKPRQKKVGFFLLFFVFLLLFFSLHQTQTIIALITKQMQLPIEILVLVRLLLRRDGIKYKNLF